MIHELKTWPVFFAAVEAGSKTFELRRDDRGFSVGDTLVLREWCPERERYTGRVESRAVTHVARDAERFGLMPGFAILSLATSDAVRECENRTAGEPACIERDDGDGYCGPCVARLIREHAEEYQRMKTEVERLSEPSMCAECADYECADVLDGGAPRCDLRPAFGGRPWLWCSVCMSAYLRLRATDKGEANDD